jgi:uncharacterized protein (DUF433 family)
MELNDYFDFVSPGEIRPKGHRVWIEHILYEYVHRGQTPEQIAANLPTLRLDQIYATILYYLLNKEAVSAYLADWLEHSERAYAEQMRNPDPRLIQLRERMAKLKAAREKQSV